MVAAGYYFLSLILGLAVSVAIGHCVISALARRIDSRLPAIPEEEPDKRVNPALTGGIERSVFTIAWTIADATAVGAGMFAWLGLKMAANWNREIPKHSSTQADFRNRWAFAGLLKGFVSMALAALGGIVANKFHELL